MVQGMGGFLRSLFGGGKQDRSEPGKGDEPVDYNGYTIQPAPRHEGSHWVVAGTISKTLEGETREYYFIRADSDASRDNVVEMTILKAKQMIDFEGDRIFDKSN